MKKVSFGLILIILSVQFVFAQNLTKQSYEKAREVLDKAVAAYGGLENLRSIQNFSQTADLFVGRSSFRQVRVGLKPDLRDSGAALTTASSLF